MELVSAGRMDWMQQRQRMLPTALSSSTHPAVRYSGQGRWATTELLASNVGGKCARHKSHHAKLLPFSPFSGDMADDDSVHLQDWSSKPLAAPQVPQSSPPLITQTFFWKYRWQSARNPFAVQNLTPTWYELESDLIFQMVMACFYLEWWSKWPPYINR